MKVILFAFILCAPCLAVRLEDEIFVGGILNKGFGDYKNGGKRYFKHYFEEMFKLKKNGLNAMFCHNSKTKHVDGVGCARMENWPSNDSEVEMRHAEVARQLELVPDKLRKGEIVKGNDLGFFILNKYLWQNDGDYKTIGLGLSPDKHAFVRPILDKVLGDNGFWKRETIAETARKFLADKSVLATSPHTGISEFTLPLLHKIHLDMEMTAEEARTFASFQEEALKHAVLPFHVMPEGIAKLKFKKIVKKREQYLQTYMRHIQNDTRGAFLYDFKNTKPEDTKPGDDVHLVARVFMDSLLFAGGLSVEGLIRVGLNALHSQHLKIASEFRPTKSEDIDVNTFDVESFVYELARHFPPVVGFPWWEKGYDANQGGSKYTHRTVMNLAMSLRDPRVFGADQDKFRLRGLDFYKEKMGNAWAQHANENDPKTNGLGPHSRGCPGQQLSIEITKAFLTEYLKQKDEWAVASKGGIKWLDVIPFCDKCTELAKIRHGELTLDGDHGYAVYELQSRMFRHFTDEKKARTSDDVSQASTSFEVSTHPDIILDDTALCFTLGAKKLCAETDADKKAWIETFSGLTLASGCI
eukprot:TRINITY_DN22600_c0_g4_i1.p1 TRINITY_DN22600_c0_g4~~TRINITY_DN22600_c0_g4_i1.p1  ORF type:complete len:583 (+),score=97.25 TRINITY_DN22600_c0_g4_i1:51-1799(+)